MQIVSAEIKIKLPVPCIGCGAIEESETIKIELRDMQLNDLIRELNSRRIGIAHPVGWASYGSGTYRCPKCII